MLRRIPLTLLILPRRAERDAAGDPEPAGRSRPGPPPPATAKRGQLVDQQRHRARRRSTRCRISSRCRGTPRRKAAAKTIAQVLWDDLDFEREFYMIPRDTYGAIPAARSVTDVPFDRWRELGADGLLIGTVQKDGTGLKIQVRLFNVVSRQAVFAREYTGSAGNPRAYAHTTADEIHQQQRALRGIARTKLTFSSDRDREKVTDTVENRDVKEIYIADYDGANQRRITVNRALNITPTWAPDGRSIAYTSYARGFPTLFISFIYEGRRDEPTRAARRTGCRPGRPTGRRSRSRSNRDGNAELYVMNRDGGGMRRLTNHPGHRHDADLVADRRADRVHLRSVGLAGDLRGRQRRAEPAPDLDAGRLLRPARPGRRRRSTNWRSSAATGPGYDIKIFDFATERDAADHVRRGQQREPGLFAQWPASRVHVDACRQGAGVHGRPRRQESRQVTKVGSNFTPDWSH